MIFGFADKRTERLHHLERVREFQAFERAALRKLAMLDAAVAIEDLLVPPGNRLEQLKGDRAGQWSIRINGQWRLCFRWEKGDAYDVEICDYH
jgi:toxin HigB-1